jgi:phenylalanyl-tRNA synthetase beta chain
MKLPVEWLREFVDTDLGDEALAARLTMAGLEVEEIQDSDDGPVYYTKVTPNRGDWLSALGHAREAAAALDARLNWRPAPLPEETDDVAKWASVTVTDDTLCPRYAGKVIRNVTIGPSPEWMQKRIAAAGMRPLNVVVDVTNYVLLELGQPLHAFDYDTLPEGKIVVRPSKAGEGIVTLDGTERPLPPGTLVICDKERPIAVAGIMGGGATEVTEKTRHIFLESAHFDPGSIRRTAKALNLTTEASYRFERHVDPGLVVVALERAAELLAAHAGGEIVLGRIDTAPQERPATRIALRPSRTNAILGTALDVEQIALALRRLGLHVEHGDPLTVRVPSFRPDLVKEIDLIEEVGRIIGYDNLPETLPRRIGSAASDSPLGLFTNRVRNVLAGAGLREATTHSFAPPSAFDAPEHAEQRITLRHAISAELSGLRLSLVPNLLQALAHNIRQRQLDVRLFEAGKVFLRANEGVYEEPRRVAAVLTGRAAPRGWAAGEARAVDFYTAKGLVESLAESLRVAGIAFEPAVVTGMHPGRTAAVRLNAAVIGYVAEVDPDLAREELDLPAGVGRIAVFELDLKVLMADASSTPRYRQLPRFPSVSRDISVEVDRTLTFASIDAAARFAADPDLLEELAVLSVYTGDKVAEDKKAVAFRLTFRAQGRTLTDADVDAQVTAVDEALRERLGAVRR